MMPRVGDRVRITGIMRDPDPIPVGAEGTVDYIHNGPIPQIGVDWDNGRALLLLPHDPFTVVT